MAVEEGRALAARVVFGTAFWAREVRLPGGRAAELTGLGSARLTEKHAGSTR